MWFSGVLSFIYLVHFLYFFMSSSGCFPSIVVLLFFFQAEDGIRDLVRSRGLGDVYKRQPDNLVRLIFVCLSVVIFNIIQLIYFHL